MKSTQKLLDKGELALIAETSGKKSESEAIICPVCGAKAVQEKCKVVCRSEICRGRIVMNCSEF
jgi:hypothetical protein